MIEEGSQRYREVLRWTASSTFRPLDEIAAIRHNEDALPEGQRSTELYLLAIEVRRADFILDEINSDVAGLADDRFRDFLANLLYRWGGTETPAMNKKRNTYFIGSPAYGHPASSWLIGTMLDSGRQTARHTLEAILAMQEYPFTALLDVLAAIHHSNNA